MELFYILLVLLLVTRIFGELSVRFGQPVLVGELCAGVCLGLIVKSFEEHFPVLSELSHNSVFEAITDLGIFFLMLLAGIEMRPKDISKATGPALAVALGGFLLPMALGLGLGYWAIPESEWKAAQMLYIGVALSVTAVPITIATLMELDKHRSRVGVVIVSAAVFDDLISLFLLAVLTSVLKSGTQVDFISLALLAGKVVIFFAVTTLIGLYIFPLIGRWTKRLKAKHIELSMLLGWALAFSVLAEILGMHFVLGAYVAGLLFTTKTIDEIIHRDLHIRVEAVTFGFFAPLFFASIGMSINLAALTTIPVFLIILIAAAFLGKILGSGLAGRMCGMSSREALAVGVGMNARGAVELIIAGIALRAGLFSHPKPTPPIVEYLFSAVVLMAICAALVSPLALRTVFQQISTNNGANEDEESSENSPSTNTEEIPNE